MFKILFNLMVGGIVFFGTLTSVSAQVKFNVRMTDPDVASETSTYSVYAKNLNAYTPTLPTTITSTINVTVKLPGGYDLDPFGGNVFITNFKGIFREGSSRSRPAYAPNSNYLYFSMSGTPNFAEWAESDVEVELFRFEITGQPCVAGEVSIIDDQDPIIFSDDEVNYDFTNQFSTVLGPQFEGRYWEGDTNCSGVVSDVSALAFEGGVQLQPNPTKDNTTLYYDFEETIDLNVQIMNSLGQLVYETKEKGAQNGQIALNVANYAAGFYFVHLTDGVNVTTKQLIVAAD